MESVGSDKIAGQVSCMQIHGEVDELAAQGEQGDAESESGSERDGDSDAEEELKREQVLRKKLAAAKAKFGDTHAHTIDRTLKLVGTSNLKKRPTPLWHSACSSPHPTQTTNTPRTDRYLPPRIPTICLAITDRVRFPLLRFPFPSSPRPTTTARTARPPLLSLPSESLKHDTTTAPRLP